MNSGNVFACIERGTAKAEIEDLDGATADFEKAIVIGVDYALGTNAGRLFYDVKERVARAAERSRVQSEMDQLLEMSEEERQEQKRRTEAAEGEQYQLLAQLEQLSKALADKEQITADTPLNLEAIRVQYYSDRQGREPYTDWLSGLSRTPNQRVRDVITQMRRGNLGDYKPLQNCPGLFERRLDSGQRIYLAKLPDSSILILQGGDKSDQQSDIDIAAERLADWRARHPK
ncbi:MAG: hypothetical protein F4X64_10645 [Chloroflexi bacterium]|nr:hypothetical protein [Chloroflexota bacterium]